MDTDREIIQNEILSSNGIRYIKDLDSSEANNLSIEKLELPKIVTKSLSYKLSNDTFEEESIDFQDYLNNPRILHDITYGLDNFEFESGLETDNISRYSIIRLRSHASYVYACAHACYFIGHANRFKRNLNDIKLNRIKQLNTRTDFGHEKLPGLIVGIIGAGRLGRQLAEALIEYGDVQPHELLISTRQPDILNEFKSKGVDCSFNNRKIAENCDIIFLCVLPSQIDDVIDDIRKNLKLNSIIYSYVRTIPAKRLKNFIDAESNSIFIFKPNYDYNTECTNLHKWNFSLDIIESINQPSMISMTNPLLSEQETLIKSGEYFMAGLVYAIINLCCFMDINKNECLAALRAYLFSTSTNGKFKFDETLFFNEENNESFNKVDLTEALSGPTQFSNKLSKSKALITILSNNYTQYFDDLIKQKTNPYK